MKITGPRKNHCFAVLLLLAILNTKFCSSFQIKQDHCITCDSSKDENCRANVTSDMIARCPIQLLYDDQINTGCFHYEDTNDIVRRGCVSAAKQELRELCQSNSEVCKTCSNKDEKGSCNNIPGFQKCFDCNSRDNDNCAQINNSTKTTICKQYFSTCVTGIDKNGYTHRLCSDGFVDGNKREIPNGFEECLQTKCNGNIFPKERLMCHQCNNGNGYDDLPAEFLKTSTILSEPHACKTFSLYDQCYTYIGEGE